MMKQELKYYIKANKLIILSHAFLLSLFFVLIYVFFQATTLSAARVNVFNRIYQNHEMFTIRTDLEDEEFFDALENEDMLTRMGIFYDTLNQSPDVKFLSIHHQFISIRNFRGGVTFDYNYEFKHWGYIEVGPYLFEDEWYTDIRTLQMNQQAFEFFDLRISEGEIFSWEDIDYSNNHIPILLGAEYRDIYHVGDVLEGTFLSVEFQFEVIGFFEANSAIFYFNLPEYYLDKYIVIPYPYSLQAFALVEDGGQFKTDPWFRGSLSLGMIIGDLVVESGPDALGNVLNTLSIVADVSGFGQYRIMGVPDFAVQFGRMVSILSYNQRLLVIALSLCMALVGVISVVTSRFLFKKRLSTYDVLFICGWSREKVAKLILNELLLLSLLSFILFIIWLQLSGIASVLQLLWSILLLYLPFLSGFIVALILLIGLMSITYQILKLELKKYVEVVK